MKNYKVTCAYDGSRYRGWQRLGEEQRTIQGILEASIENILSQKIVIHGSGRTDAGVHAKGQVFHMKLPFILNEDFLMEINGKLPEDICILKVELVKESFHARYDAVGKIYSYYVNTCEKPSVFKHKYEYHFPFAVDVERMRKAAKYLIGCRDFTSFTDDKKVEKSKTRTLQKIEVVDENGCLRFTYHGDGFLQHMVRIITGTLLEIGRGDRAPEDVLRILSEKKREVAGFLVPAKGLFLEEVKYS